MDAAADSPARNEPAVPRPTGACPRIAQGESLFSPAGAAPRQVRFWMSDAVFDAPRPLILYWHASGSNTTEVESIGFHHELEAIVAAGGIVAAPNSEAEGEVSLIAPWYLLATTRDDDLLVADEIVGCAVKHRNADPRRIHTAGYSAGGLQAAIMSLRRSGYVASVVSYSGGLVGPVPSQNPDNRFAAMIFHGGADDFLYLRFAETSRRFHDALKEAGHSAFLCEHEYGHGFPYDARLSWQFFSDHPWGTAPSPYENGRPANFPRYCGGEREAGLPPAPGDAGPHCTAPSPEAGVGCTSGTPCDGPGETCPEAVACGCLLECRDGAWAPYVCP